ncbi:hypothetical protein ACP4OV_002317 [Aristida adscensionis]
MASPRLLEALAPFLPQAAAEIVASSAAAARRAAASPLARPAGPELVYRLCGSDAAIAALHADLAAAARRAALALARGGCGCVPRSPSRADLASSAAPHPHGTACGCVPKCPPRADLASSAAPHGTACGCGCGSDPKSPYRADLASSAAPHGTAACSSPTSLGTSSAGLASSPTGPLRGLHQDPLPSSARPWGPSASAFFALHAIGGLLATTGANSAPCKILLPPEPKLFSPAVTNTWASAHQGAFQPLEFDPSIRIHPTACGTGVLQPGFEVALESIQTIRSPSGVLVPTFGSEAALSRLASVSPDMAMNTAHPNAKCRPVPRFSADHSTIAHHEDIQIDLEELLEKKRRHEEFQSSPILLRIESAQHHMLRRADRHEKMLEKLSQQRKPDWGTITVHGRRLDVTKPLSFLWRLFW